MKSASVNRLTRTYRIPRLFLLALLLILLPVLLYSVYELTTLNAAERLLASTYARQLDGVLASVNQYSWDVVSGWASSFERILVEEGDEKIALQRMLDRHAGPAGVFVADSAGNLQAILLRTPDADLSGRVGPLVRREARSLDRLVMLRQAQYTRLDPVVLDSSGIDSRVALVFVIPSPEGAPRLAGLLVDPGSFVNGTIAPRLRETAGTEFILAVVRRSSGTLVLSTDTIGPGEVLQRKPLWILPEYEAGIRFRGTSVEELAAGRSRRSLWMVVLLDVLLISGVWLVYRTIRKGIEFARLRADFVSNISHELRTPLALIRMYAETLEMGRIPDPKRRSDYLATIVTETGRLSRLVNNILNFSRMEAGRMPYSFVPTDLNAIVRSVLDVWDPKLSEESVKVVTNLDAELPAVMADGEAVTEALINLVDNAEKYGGRGKYLRIATCARGSNVVVDVEDHGIGIAPHHQTKIFEMFYRVASGSHTAVRGSGVGLSLVRHIMLAHDGDVKVLSTPGQGSVFSLVFPNGNYQAS